MKSKIQLVSYTTTVNISCDQDTDVHQIKEKSPKKTLTEKSFLLRQQLAENITSIVGFKEALLSKHSIIKYSWIFLFLVGTASTVFFVYKTTREYLDEPTATKIKLNVSATYDTPPIALCPAAWWDAYRPMSLNLSADGLKYSLAYIDIYAGMRLDNIAKGKKKFLDFYVKNNFSSLLDYYKMIALDFETVYSSEMYNNLSTGIKLSDPKSINMGKLFMSFEICYAYLFRPAGSSLASTSASLKFYDQTNGTAKILPSIWIQLVSDLDFLSNLLPPIYVASYSRSKISISSRRFVTLDRSDAPCSPATTEAQTSYACAVACQNDEYKQIINCLLFRYSSVSGAEPPEEYCNLFERILIKNWTFPEFRSSEINERITDKCLAMCPSKCDKIIYEINLQWQQIVAPLADDPKKIFAEFFFEHTARYEGETVTFVEVNAYTFTDFVNNVGGTLGLFIGATLMTFAQLILFFLEYLFGKK